MTKDIPRGLLRLLESNDNTLKLIGGMENDTRKQTN